MTTTVDKQAAGMMNIYLLKRTCDIACGEMASIVVCAENEKHARQIASGCCGEEGPVPWVTGYEWHDDEDAYPVDCELLTATREHRVVCRDFA